MLLTVLKRSVRWYVRDISRGIAISIMWILCAVAANAASGPTITGLSITSGAVGAGVTISGSGFGNNQGTSSVKFNGTPVSSVSSWSASQLVVVVPSAATSGSIVVTVSGRSSNGVSFTILPTPVLSSINPNMAAAGTAVTLIGSNFGSTQGLVVFPNDVWATVSAWSDTSISAIVPAGDTTGLVSVSASGVTTNGVMFKGIPYISYISPGFGSPGSSVTINGINFGSTQGSVSFGSISANITSWSSGQIIAVVPSGASSSNVVVSANGTSSNPRYFAVGALSAATYHLHIEAAPYPFGGKLLSPTPPDAPSTVLQTTVLKGANSSAYSIAAFDGAPVPEFVPMGSTATFSLWMQETTAVPSLYPNVQVWVFDSAGNSTFFCTANASSALTTTLTKIQFTCPVANTFTLNNSNMLGATIGVANQAGGAITQSVQLNLYIEGSLNGNYDSQISVPGLLYPYITSVSPGAGPASTIVTVAGGQFGATQGSSTVSFNGIIGAPSSWSDTTIKVPVPVNATTGPLVITVSGQSITWGSFTVFPSFTSIVPPTGPVGTSVTLTGNAFGASQGTSGISFGGIPAAVTSWSSNSITAVVPMGAKPGPVSVTVAGVATNGPTFAETPLVTGLSSTSGAVGSPVRILGYNFGTVQGAVTFNGVAAAAGSWLDGSIVVTVPSGATTGPVVVTANGVASNPVTFTLAPRILSLSPNSGASGTSVTIAGVNFGASQGSSRVLFNGVPASPSSWSDTAIVVAAPLGATGGPVSVVVGGTSSNGVPFGFAPVISSVTPTSGVAGTQVAISGSNFGQAYQSGLVTFNGLPGTTKSWNGNAIAVAVPAGATTGPIVVTVNGVASNGVAFTVGSSGLSGSVTKASDGSAISGATVQLVQAKTTLATTNTAADGSYTIGNVPAGTYDVVASASGYGTIRDAGVALNPNANATANVTLGMAGTVSGIVTKTDGVTGISGATVVATQGGDLIGSATTDASGNYAIATLGAGTYDLTASSTGYTSFTQSGQSVTSGTVISVAFQLLSQSLISYTYDQNGRLTSATDSKGDTATYQYDAVGNITSIGRYPSSQTSVIQLSPTSGPIGTTVTISGTGFSSVAAQNSVSFNGTAAVVTSASPTQLVTTVPSGTSSGLVSVTAPSGTAASTSPFTVTAGSGAVAITNISPTSGTAGTPLTVTGTGFDSTPINDVLAVNLAAASITSASSTTLVSSVPPQTASGHISVRTRAGSATSSQDFYVPFGTHAVADIGYTGRMAPNNTQTISIGAAGKIGLMLFDGTAGQAISILTTNSTFGNCNIILFDPFGRQLSSTGCTGSGNFTDAQVLAYTGTYTIGIDPGGTTGSLAVSLYNFNDQTGTITPGVPQTTTISTPGQNAKLTFGGIAGQHVSLSLHNSTFPDPCSFCSTLTATVLKPDGTALGSTTIDYQSGVAFMDSIMLPATGIYTLVINPLGRSTGNVTEQIFLFDNEFGTIAASTPQSTTTTTPGQTASYTFSAAAGQQVSLSLYNSTYFDPCSFCSTLTATILKPDGTTLGSTTIDYQSGVAFMDSITVPTTGIYTLVIDPLGWSTGTVTEQLFLFNDQSGTITLGTSQSTSVSIPGQNAKYTFSGSAGQQISMILSNSNFFDPCRFCSTLTGTIVNPDGTTLGSTTVDYQSGAAFMDSVSLPTTGTYTLIMNPLGWSTGTVTEEIYPFNDVSGAITPGAPLPISISFPGQNAKFTFSGTAGQQVSLSLSGSTFNDPCAFCATVTGSIVNPDGSTLGSATVSYNGSGASFGPLSLPTTGTYVVLINPLGWSTGNLNALVGLQ